MLIQKYEKIFLRRSYKKGKFVFENKNQIITFMKNIKCVVVGDQSADKTKIVEVDNKILEITIDEDNPIDFSQINAFVFMFNILKDESLQKLKEIFFGTTFSSFLSRNKKFPRIVIGHYNENINQITSLDKYIQLGDEFKCPFYIINSESHADIESAFYLLLKQIVKRKLDPRKKVKSDKQKNQRLKKGAKSITKKENRTGSEKQGKKD